MQWLPIRVTVPVSTTNSLITKYTYNQNTATLTEATVEDNTGKLFSKVNYEYDTYSNPTTVRIKGDTVDTVIKMQYGYRSMLPTRQDVNVTGVDGTISTISVQAAYNLRGEITRYVDGNGNATVATYDAIGRPTTETNPDGSVTTIKYDDLLNKVSVTDPRGNVRTYEYDPLGRLVREVDVRGVTSYTLDEYGRLVAKRDPAGDTTFYSYDANSRVLTENDGTSQIQYIYNDGNRTRLLLVDLPRIPFLDTLLDLPPTIPITKFLTDSSICALRSNISNNSPFAHDAFSGVFSLSM